MSASSLAYADYGTTLTEEVLVPKPSAHATEGLTGERRTLRAHFGERGQTDLEISFSRDEIPNVVVDLFPKIVRLRGLKPNWDSYGGSVISLEIVESAITLLSNLMKDDSPAPSVIPTSRGGIQFTWEVGSKYLEIEVFRPNRIEAYYVDESHPDSETEGEFSVKLNELRRYVEAITIE